MNPHRARAWAALDARPAVDVAIVGGGATGVATALAAARAGYRVALFEARDFASGTSSRSTKLLHGGVRYLAQGRLGLVREALSERTALLRLAPHLAQPLAFVVPAYARWDRLFYGAGLTAYDVLAGGAGLGRTAWLGPAETRAALPGVRTQGLRGGVRYWDAQFDDARLTIAFARSAEAAGAHVFNHAEVTAVQPAPGRGRLRVRDRWTGDEREVAARVILNATGVWVDALRSGHPDKPLVRVSQGVHLVVDRDRLGGEQALLRPRTADGRVLFAVPWLGKLLIGTTDTPRPVAAHEPSPTAAEMEFLLREASRALEQPLTLADVCSHWAGLRPLVHASGATAALSREHHVLAEAGLITVTGGKWTTCRVMAADVLRSARHAGWLADPGPPPCPPNAPLIGAPAPGAPPVPLHRPPGLHLLGAEAAAVARLPGSERDLGAGLSEAMVRWAVRHEHAATVEDVLARRWRTLFLDAAVAAALAPAVAAIVAEETGGAAGADTEAFLALCRRYRGPA